MKSKRVNRETKIDVVFAIVYGNMTMKEATEKYDVAKKSTIISWIRTLLPEAKLMLEATESKVTGGADFENIGVKMYERIARLEQEKNILERERAALRAKLLHLEAKSIE
ncbi:MULTISPECIES: hypothetical protein [Sphingobacterium]|uniref:hypothetical protein n=1 Tax=Sphingobacterium TaxID=28453 RepID=UPI0006280071|nr:hypothetical protein [Sphingobacterium sp. Ag1]KKO88995.1 hypothetical protein AAW12_22775 [Sphingobacterium sp. Ag1]